MANLSRSSGTGPLYRFRIMNLRRWFIRKGVVVGSGLFSVRTLALWSVQVFDPARFHVSAVTVSLLALAGMPWILPIVKRLDTP